MLLFLESGLSATAQRHQIYTENIQSLQVTANDDWLSMPVMELGNGTLAISFDDMTHEYRRYMYRLEHCEADWSVSEELFESDFCGGFASGNTIDDVQESLLTNVLYTHYSFHIPNEKCRIKMSGNYKLTVYDDNNEEKPVLTACFMVVEPLMGVSLSVTSNTDLDINNAHQQVSMNLNYGNIGVANPQTQIKTVVLQNGRWDNARWNAKPQYVMADGLRWEHNRELIFEAGNEYRKFEILSTDVASMGIDRIRWDGEEYHAYPFLSLPRPNYLYDEDTNGAFLVRNSDNIDADFTSDYMSVHFQLQSPYEMENPVYINANWTNDRFLPKYRMEYDEETKTYEAVVRLKLGYYSYQYVMLDEKGNVRTLPTEGNFYQTENKYQALVYYREQGGRTDRLVGYQQVQTR
ncbi:MAG: DUF5103 domain-containing protein [Prevotella sp.]|nr:DUF5103 domain-containing protein [Prevotella sp.]